jgi:hypothetical protein
MNQRVPGGRVHDSGHSIMIVIVSASMIFIETDCDTLGAVPEGNFAGGSLVRPVASQHARPTTSGAGP